MIVDRDSSSIGMPVDSLLTDADIINETIPNQSRAQFIGSPVPDLIPNLL